MHDALPSMPDRSRSASPAEPLDMEALILSVSQLVDAWCSDPVRARTITRTTFDPLEGPPSHAPASPTIVLGPDVAVELGPPSLASCALLLTTSNRSGVRHGRVTVVGPDLPQVRCGARMPFAQIIMLATAAGVRPDPFSLENAQYLLHRLPGYMARSIPGRLWIRVSRDVHASGLTLTAVGRLLIQTYLSRFPEIVAGEVIFVTSSGGDVQAFAPLALEAQVIAGLHRKLAISPDGDLSCAELACDSCEEKPVCDGLREMLQQRGKRP